MSDFYNNFNQQQNFQQNNFYNNNYSDRCYGLSGEQEYVMTVKDYIKVWLFMMIPFYNFYFIIRILIGPTSRTNKTFTNSLRLAFIMGLVSCVITIPLTLLGVNKDTSGIDNYSYADRDESFSEGRILSSSDKLELLIGDQTLLIDGLEGWTVTSQQSNIVFLTLGDTSVNYSNSYVETNSREDVLSWSALYNEAPESSYSVTTNLDTSDGSYFFVARDIGTVTDLHILQNVGLDYYLEISISYDNEDLNFSDPEQVAKTFMINLQG